MRRWRCISARDKGDGGGGFALWGVGVNSRRNVAWEPSKERKERERMGWKGSLNGSDTCPLALLQTIKEGPARKRMCCPEGQESQKEGMAVSRGRRGMSSKRLPSSEGTTPSIVFRIFDQGVKSFLTVLFENRPILLSLVKRNGWNMSLSCLHATSRPFENSLVQGLSFRNGGSQFMQDNKITKDQTLE